MNFLEAGEASQHTVYQKSTLKLLDRDQGELKGHRITTMGHYSAQVMMGAVHYYWSQWFSKL